MKLFKTLLASAVVIASTAAFAHGTVDHAKKAGPVKKEQKDWGIAGDAKAANRTIEVSMLDTMKFSPDMEHDEPYMAHVPAGKTGEIIWKFNKAGNFDFACLIAGHYQAGMIGKITVAAAGKSGEHPQHKR